MSATEHAPCLGNCGGCLCGEPSPLADLCWPCFTDSETWEAREVRRVMAEETAADNFADWVREGWGA